MEIRKADSKGRVTGFEPGRYYQILKTDSGSFTLIPTDWIENPEEVEQALAQIRFKLETG